MNATEITPAGKRLLCRFIECEKRMGTKEIGPRLSTFRSASRGEFLALRLPEGDGGAKAAAAKLAADGYAEFNWTREAKMLLITDKGRAAISAACPS